MKYVKTFESFTGNVNEGKHWFPGSTIDDEMEFGDPAFDKFFNTAKPGDTFMTSPSGVDAYFLKNKNDFNKKPKVYKIDTTYFGNDYGGGEEEKATVLGTRTVVLDDDGGDFDPSKGTTKALFYKIENDDRIFVLPKF